MTSRCNCLHQLSPPSFSVLSQPLTPGPWLKSFGQCFAPENTPFQLKAQNQGSYVCLECSCPTSSPLEGPNDTPNERFPCHSVHTNNRTHTNNPHQFREPLPPPRLCNSTVQWCLFFSQGQVLLIPTTEKQPASNHGVMFCHFLK